MDILYAFSLEPGADFVRSNHGRAGAFGDLHNIRDMIAMTVRNEDAIGADLVDIDFFREWVWRNERIEKERLAACLDGETSVAVVGKLHERQIRGGVTFFKARDAALRRRESHAEN